MPVWRILYTEVLTVTAALPGIVTAAPPGTLTDTALGTLATFVQGTLAATRQESVHIPWTDS